MFSSSYRRLINTAASTRLAPLMYNSSTFLKPSWNKPQFFFFSNSTSSSITPHSPTNNNALWVMVSALFFIPAFIYLTKPPDEFYSHKSRKDHLLPPANHAQNNTMPAKPDPPSSFKYVLIGGGTASYSALMEIRNLDPTGEILMITDEEFPPYERPPLSKELWLSANDKPTASNQFSFVNWEGQPTSLFYDDVPNFDLFTTATDLHPSGSGTKLLTKTTATNLNLDKQTITLSSGATIHFDKLLLATGASPRQLPFHIPEAVRRRVVTYRTLADYQKLRTVANTGKKILVIGGGFLGSELALALANSGNNKVTQVFPEEGNMGLVFPKYLARWTTHQVQSEGVHVVPNALVTGLKYDDNTDQILVQVNNDQQDMLPFDHVVVAVGVQPNITLAKKAGLEIDPVSGGIMVNAELEARHNVFCAGDNVSFHDLTLGRRRVEHYDNAVSQGRWAGQAMALGKPKPFTHQSMFWSDLGSKLGYEAVGDLDGTLVTVSVWGVHDLVPENGEASLDPVEKEFRKGVVFYVRDQKIVGVLMMNVRGQADVAREILARGHDPSEAKSLAAKFHIFSK